MIQRFSLSSLFLTVRLTLDYAVLSIATYLARYLYIRGICTTICFGYQIWIGPVAEWLERLTAVKGQWLGYRYNDECNRQLSSRA